MKASLATLLFLGALMPLPGARHAGYAPTGGTAWLAILVAAVIGVVSAVLATRWTRATGWTDVHTAAALTAALAGHTVIGLLTLVHSPLDRMVLGGLGVVEVCLLVTLLHHTIQRATLPSSPPRSA